MTYERQEALPRSDRATYYVFTKPVPCEADRGGGMECGAPAIVRDTNARSEQASRFCADHK